MEKKGKKVNAYFDIVTPDNWTPMFDANNKEKIAKVIENEKPQLEKIINHKGEIFGNTREECGNYRNLNLEASQIEAERYLNVLNSKEVTFKYE